MAIDYTEVKLDKLDDVIEKLGFNPTGDVQQHLTNTAFKLMDKHVPYRDGNLRGEAVVESDRIIYGPPGSVSQPYARAMYYGYYDDGTEFRFNQRPQRGAEWDKKMMADSMDRLVRDVQKFVDKRKNK